MAQMILEMNLQSILVGCLLFFICHSTSAQHFTRQDTLRGSLTPERTWWDLTYYDLAIDVDIPNKFLRGSNTIAFNVLATHQLMQIDLQEPLFITRIDYKGKDLAFKREGNVYWVSFPQPLPAGTSDIITVFYEGHPVEAIRPPWDGGLTWSRDDQQKPFVATSCQGKGSSVWWPCKDHMYDEPDSMLIRITAPQELMDVSNGRLRKVDYFHNGKRTWHWFVSNPINNYGVNANIADYAHWSDTIHGEGGILDLDFYVLENSYEVAQTHFDDVQKTIRAFEYWFGPYPFYEDGFKLVEVPYLGMEHQSSVTYGNKYRKGYLGNDLSSTGWGLKWDFIIVHETAHEWWANSVTYKDVADMWIHESFANYAESLFLEYHFGKQAGFEYVRGTRQAIQNDRPIIGIYNVNHEGSGDMYHKGGNMLHTLRMWIHDDVLWRNILRGIQQDFRHQTVTTDQIENYIARQSGKDLDAFFDQYLRDTRIPVLEYEVKKNSLKFRYINSVAGFNLPLLVNFNKGEEEWIYPNTEWQTIRMNTPVKSLEVNPNFYIVTSKVE